MNTDEVVSDIISLSHSITKSNYVTCSQLTSKIFSYLSQIPLDKTDWHEFQRAIERFNESFDHPDLHQCQNLIEKISACANDSEERNYTLGRDKMILANSIYQLRDLLQSHIDLGSSLLMKLIEKQEIRLYLNDLMNLTTMNVGMNLHGVICEIIHLLMQIDPTLAKTSIVDHPIVLHCIRLIETIDDKHVTTDSFTIMIAAVRLLTGVLLTLETLPVQTRAHLSDHRFLTLILCLIEKYNQNEDLILNLLKFLLAFNLRFDDPLENPIIQTLLAETDEFVHRNLIERLILLFNRGVDPISHHGDHSVIKFLADLMGAPKTLTDECFSQSDRRLIIEIISRELSNRDPNESITVSYLSLLELCFRHRKIDSDTCTRIEELTNSLNYYRNHEQSKDEHHFIIEEIFRQHPDLLSDQ